MISNQSMVACPTMINSFGPEQSETAACVYLTKLGCTVVSSGNCDDKALSIFDSALNVLVRPTSVSSWVQVANFLQNGHPQYSNRVENDTDCGSPSDTVSEPDIYQEGGCDVGPRVMKRPVSPRPLEFQCQAILEAIVFFNKGLVYQSQGLLVQAKQLYDIVTFSAQSMIESGSSPRSPSLMELAVRAFNNLGIVHYLNHNESCAAICFQKSVSYAKQLATLSQDHTREYTTALSNWCRIHWIHGHVCDEFYERLTELVHLRSSFLPWNHPDVAAAHYNIAVADYARRDVVKSVAHFQYYLKVSKSLAQDEKKLDALPALVYLLLMKNEESEDPMCQELVRGLRTLQDKRQDEGPNDLEVASVLNFVGTVLFHQRDFENALAFFQEELHLEGSQSEPQPVVQSDGTTPESVTCNNLGRILQELGRYEEALDYYERCLKTRYGPHRSLMELDSHDHKIAVSPDEDIGSASNLYSTVWYNLGLIHDKLGSPDKAIHSFEMALSLRQRLLGCQHTDVACLLYNIGVLHMEQKRLTSAWSSFSEAFHIRRVGGAGQLSDRHITKTFEKLSSMFKSEGRVKEALEVSQIIASIQEASREYSAFGRLKATGNTLRTVAELHHILGDLEQAVRQTEKSVHNLRSVVLESASNLRHTNLDEQKMASHVGLVEQLTSSLLLLGSLNFERGDHLLGSRLMTEASSVICQTRASLLRNGDMPMAASLFALYEVTSMLGRPGAPAA